MKKIKNIDSMIALVEALNHDCRILSQRTWCDDEKRNFTISILDNKTNTTDELSIEVDKEYYVDGSNHNVYHFHDMKDVEGSIEFTYLTSYFTTHIQLNIGGKNLLSFVYCDCDRYRPLKITWCNECFNELESEVPLIISSGGDVYEYEH